MKAEVRAILETFTFCGSRQQGSRVVMHVSDKEDADNVKYGAQSSPRVRYCTVLDLDLWHRVEDVSARKGTGRSFLKHAILHQLASANGTEGEDVILVRTKEFGNVSVSVSCLGNLESGGME